METTLTAFSKRLFLASFFAGSILTTVSAQAQTNLNVQWDKAYGGTSKEGLYAMQPTADGGFIGGGFSLSGISGDKTQPNVGSLDFWVVKLDANGNKLWDKTYGGSATDALYAIKQTSDGGYILAGYSESGISGDKSQPNVGGPDIWLVRIDASGNKLWDKTFGGTSEDYALAILQTADGGFIISGDSKSGIGGDKSQASKGDYDTWILKIDGSGNKQWDKTIGGNGPDTQALSTFEQTSDGGFILGTTSESGVSGDKSENYRGNGDYWILKLDAAGNKVWDKTYGGSNTDKLYALKQTADGGYILGGHSNSGIGFEKSEAPKGSYDFWILKVDATGTKQWDRTLGGSNFEQLFGLQKDTDGGYVLGGISNSGISADKSQPSQGSYDYWLIKISPTGTKVWDKTFGGSGNDQLTAIQQTSNGGLIVAGHSNSGISGNKTQANIGDDDFWFVKIGAGTTGIQEIDKTNFTVYPNPSQGQFKLQITNLSVPFISIFITDLLGKSVWRQDIQVSNQEVSEPITLKGAKGIYQLQVKIKDKTVLHKLIINE